MKTYSTRETARLVGIHWITFQRWITAKRVKPSIAVPMGGNRRLYRWTAADVRKVKQFKAANYRKGRGRKKKAA